MSKTRVQRWNSSYKWWQSNIEKKSTWNSSSTILYIHLFLFFFFLPDLVLYSSSFFPFQIWFFFFFLPDMLLFSSEFGPLFLYSSFSSFFRSTSIELEFKKLKFHVDKLLHISTKTRVLKAQVCHQTQVSMTWYVSFLNSFKTMLTNEIVDKN